MTKSKIEWTDRVWNPVRGCSKVSEGCRNCYAIRQAHRFSGTNMAFEHLTKSTSHGPEWTGNLSLVHEKLTEPLKWKKPSRVFVNSMSDLFHEDVPFEFINRVFLTISKCKDHTFQILTKRPNRVIEYIQYQKDIMASVQLMTGIGFTDVGRKLKKDWDSRINEGFPNVWFGVSVEDQKTANERIPILHKIPAAVKFVSCEPLLGPVDLTDTYEIPNPIGALYGMLIDGIDWVVVGGESGPNARPMHPDWVRTIRNHCEVFKVPFFFKQWGEFLPYGQLNSDGFAKVMCQGKNSERKVYDKVGKTKAGHSLDGKEYQEFPKSES